MGELIAMPEGSKPAMEFVKLFQPIDLNGNLEVKNRIVLPKLADNGPLAVRKIKEGMMRTSGVLLDEALKIEDELSAVVMMSKDAREGPRAFKEKCRPNFTGE